MLIILVNRPANCRLADVSLSRNASDKGVVIKTKYSLSQTGFGMFFGLVTMGFLLGAHPQETRAEEVSFSEVAPDVGIAYARTRSVRNGQYGPLYLGPLPGPVARVSAKAL